MNEPLIAKLTDPNAGLVEQLQEAQLLINERDTWKRVAELAAKKQLFGSDALDWYQQVSKQLESEKISSGEVC